MRSELRRADERHEVLLSVAGWRADGAIDAATTAAIVARFPDDRRRAAPAFRVLFFLFTVLAGLAVWGFGIALTDVSLFGAVGSDRHFALLALLALLSGAGAAWGHGPSRLRGFGVEEGLVALAVGFSAGAVAVLLDASATSGRPFGAILGASLAVLALGAAWRWGTPLSGALFAAAALAALTGFAPARLLGIVAAIALAVPARRLARGEHGAPAHRARAEEVRAVALAALYLAVHPAPAVAKAIAWGRSPGEVASVLSPPLELLAWAAIFLLPGALVWRGLRERDRLELDLGALGLLASGVALRARISVGPLWLVLLAAGALLGALAVALRHAFARAAGRPLAGFTDRPLGGGGDGHWLELATMLAAFTPAPRRSDEPPAFHGEGGDFGGGGASAKF